MRIAILAWWLLAAWLAWPLFARAHSWYDAKCCSDKDCRPLEFSDVTVRPDGYHVHIAGKEFFVPFGDKRIHPTDPSDPLQRYHGCFNMSWSPGGQSGPYQLLCLYVPQGGA